MLRALVVLATLSAVLLAGLSLTTARLAESGALRSALAAEMRALGLGLDAGRVEVGEVAVGLLPPRIQISGSSVRLPRDRLLLVEQVTFEVAAWPLVSETRAEFQSADLTGRFELRGRDASVIALAVGGLERRQKDGWDVALSGSLESGGDFTLTGWRSPARERIVLSFEGVDPAPLVVLVPSLGPEGLGLAGRFEGRLELVSETDESSRSLRIALRSPAAEIRTSDVLIEGPVEVSATLDWSGALPQGPFEVDASRARVSYTAGLRSGSGGGARLAGTLVERGGSLHAEAVRLSVSAFRGQVGGADED